MKKENTNYAIEDSLLYKTNMKIHKRLLGVYSISLFTSIIVVAFKELT